MLDIYRELINAITRGERVVLATIISVKGSSPRKTGAKMLVKQDGTFVSTIGGGGIELQVQQKAMEVMKTGESQIMNFDMTGTGRDALSICGGQMDIFLEPILPLDTVYLFGAGHVSRSTASMAKMLGFRVVVIDPRPEFNNNERFPDAELIVENYDSAFSKVNIDEYGYIVIMTPQHVLDEQCLELAVGTNAKYVGMIGSKKKVKEIKERLRQKGISQQQLDGVHAPIGLEIGAESPEEIAVSIMAEVVKFRRSE